MSLPTLSVIVPNYNHAEFLPRSLSALAEQEVRPFEIIVVDDASKDNSVEVVQKLAEKFPIIRLVRNECNQGVALSVNRGLALAQGDYVLGAAADDEIVPGFIEKSLRLLAQYPAAALSCTIGDYREEHTGVNWLWGSGMADHPSYFSPADLVALEKSGRLHIPPNSVIFKRSVMQETGNYLPELKFCGDWFVNYLAAFRHGICFVPEPLAIFHVQSNSYYHRIRRNPMEYRAVLAELMRKLHDLREDQAVQLIRDSGSLSIFGVPMLRVMLSRPEYRRFITPAFLRKNLSHSAKLLLKNSSPAWLLKLYLKNSGYRPAAKAS